MESKKTTAPGAPKPVPVQQGKLINHVRFVLDLLMHITENIGALFLSVMTLIITWQVVARFKFISITSPWTEEVAIMLLVWFGMTGAAIGIRKGSHIGVEFVVALFPKKTQRFINVMIGLIILVFSIFLFVEGIALVIGCKDVIMTVTLISRGLCVYSAVPIAAFLMILYSLEILFLKPTPTEVTTNEL